MLAIKNYDYNQWTTSNSEQKQKPNKYCFAFVFIANVSYEYRGFFVCGVRIMVSDIPQNKRKTHFELFHLKTEITFLAVAEAKKKLAEASSGITEVCVIRV